MKKFFINIWQWIKKAWAVTIRFFKENVWATILAIVAAIIIFVFALQGIIKAVDSCNNQESQIENMATPITSEQFQKMIDETLTSDKTYVVFIGSKTCGHCAQFHETINTYLTYNPDKIIYYYETDDESDLNRTKMNVTIEEKLTTEIPEDRNIEGLATPTTVFIKEGEFKDAVQGAYGMEGGNNFLLFSEIIEGKYVGKDYPKFDGDQQVTPQA